MSEKKIRVKSTNKKSRIIVTSSDYISFKNITEYRPIKHFFI